jgi:hypothetical protein
MQREPQTVLGLIEARKIALDPKHVVDVAVYRSVPPMQGVPPVQERRVSPKDLCVRGVLSHRWNGKQD